jgi:hypothetical protein
MNNTNSIKRWILDYPGHFDGADSFECLAGARDAYQHASGETSDPDFFAFVLKSAGYAPTIIKPGP